MATHIDFYLENAEIQALKEIQVQIEKELARRRQEERNLLISNFKSALRALHEAHIDVYVEGGCRNCADDVTLPLTDNFYFD